MTAGLECLCKQLRSAFDTESDASSSSERETVLTAADRHVSVSEALWSLCAAQAVMRPASSSVTWRRDALCGVCGSS